VAKSYKLTTAVDWYDVCVDDYKAAARHEKTTAKAWDSTGAMLVTQKLVPPVGENETIEDYRSKAQGAVLEYLNSTLAAEVPDVVEKDGAPWKTRGKDGIKWRSLPYTKSKIQYLSTIFGAVQKVGYDAVFPDGVLLPKHELDKLLKGDKETPYQTCLRALEMLGNKFPEITEAVEISAVIEAIMAQYVACQKPTNSVATASVSEQLEKAA